MYTSLGEVTEVPMMFVNFRLDVLHVLEMLLNSVQVCYRFLTALQMQNLRCLHLETLLLYFKHCKVRLKMLSSHHSSHKQNIMTETISQPALKLTIKLWSQPNTFIPHSSAERDQRSSKQSSLALTRFWPKGIPCHS